MSTGIYRCGKSFGSRRSTPDTHTLQMSQFGALQAACQSLKGSSPSGGGLPRDSTGPGARRTSTRLRFFGHLARLNPEEDHHRVIAAALRPPSDWRRPTCRPKTTWLRTIGSDLGLQSQNFGVHTAWRKAKERDTWHQVVSTATL